MRIHVLERVQHVPHSPEDVFAFFGDIRNLEPMTPPWLHFRVLTDPSLKLRPGALIEYRLRLHGIPIRWTTEVVEWEPARRFFDVQRRGPYAMWEHTHTFTTEEGGTRIEDRVRYALPFGALGTIANAAFVERDLRRIFDFRRDAAADLLGRLDRVAEAPARSS